MLNTCSPGLKSLKNSPWKKCWRRDRFAGGCSLPIVCKSPLQSWKQSWFQRQKDKMDDFATWRSRWSRWSRRRQKRLEWPQSDGQISKMKLNLFKKDWFKTFFLWGCKEYAPKLCQQHSAQRSAPPPSPCFRQLHFWDGCSTVVL